MKLVDDISRKSRSGLCAAFGCCNKRYKYKKRFVSTLCPKHIRQRYKENNPIGYSFDILRQNAKRRGHEFLLSLDQFRKFCQETNYIERKGRSGSSMTIDRIRAHEGYKEGNIQIMTNSANSRKAIIDRMLAEKYGPSPDWDNHSIDVSDIIN